jgi:uncharacterized protein YbjT (DUF2867 family)
VGKEMLSLLIKTDYYNSVHVISRRPYFFEHPKIESYTLSFDELQAFKPNALFRDVYVCLGTTLNKAGTIENFRKVDLHYVMELARWAKRNNVSRFAVISSIGADKEKRNYYLQTKGQMEDELQAMDFEQLVIIRPSLLLGEREETRLAEQMGKYIAGILSPLLSGKLKKYKPVEAIAVAKKMFSSTINTDQAVLIIENDQLIMQ